MRKAPVERLMSKVQITETCWLWTASVNHNGYGIFHLEGRDGGAHRAAYRLLVGPIPDGLTLDHLCRVRACVNPDHLEPVTLRENILRGKNPPSLNAAKTHCVRGHAFTEDNIHRVRGHRVCRTCRLAGKRAYAQRKRDEARSAKAVA